MSISLLACVAAPLFLIKDKSEQHISPAINPIPPLNKEHQHLAIDNLSHKERKLLSSISNIKSKHNQKKSNTHAYIQNLVLSNIKSIENGKLKREIENAKNMQAIHNGPFIDPDSNASLSTSERIEHIGNFKPVSYDQYDHQHEDIVHLGEFIEAD